MYPHLHVQCLIFIVFFFPTKIEFLRQILITFNNYNIWIKTNHYEPRCSMRTVKAQRTPPPPQKKRLLELWFWNQTRCNNQHKRGNTEGRPMMGRIIYCIYFHFNIKFTLTVPCSTISWQTHGHNPNWLFWRVVQHYINDQLITVLCWFHETGLPTVCKLLEPPICGKAVSCQMLVQLETEVFTSINVQHEAKLQTWQ